VTRVPKIKIDDALYDRVKKIAETAGYASADEFIVHIIERELSKVEAADDEQQVIERLRGLGYIE
jgi:metal-responsive CopG/Arc/MetJ family transcriptional regulator